MRKMTVRMLAADIHAGKTHARVEITEPVDPEETVFQLIGTYDITVEGVYSNPSDPELISKLEAAIPSEE